MATNSKIRWNAVITYVQLHQPCTVGQIVEGATFANGKLLRLHGRLSPTTRELTAMLMAHPDFKRGENPNRGTGGIMWSYIAPEAT